MLPSVLLVTNEYPPDTIAGTAVSTQLLAEEHTSRGGRVTVVVNTRRLAPRHEIDQGLNVIRLRPVNLPGTRMAQRAALLINIARRMRPDIIQGHSLSCGCLALLAGRCLGVPAVAYIQGFDLYEAGLWERRTYIAWTLKHSDRVVAADPVLRAKAYELSGRWGEVITAGLRAHPAQRFDRETARAQLHLPMEARLVLFVGRLIPRKGVTHLIRAMGRVVSQCPDARLVLVGEGEERRQLTELTRKLTLEEHVIFAGLRPHEDVIRSMWAADVFVLPSLVEPFGIVLIEAMSCGLPVVASNVMGIPSIVEDGRNGFLTPPGDEIALADRITRLLVDPGQRSAFGQENARKALDYAMPLIADRFLNLWEGALASRRSSRS